jgi:hypothetical protein
VGQNPGFILKAKNMARSDAPNTTSGVAIGRKIKRFVAERPRNLCRPNAKAISVPKIVAVTVASSPIFIELPRAEHTSGAPQGFFQLLKVKPRHVRLLFPALLNENAKV